MTTSRWSQVSVRLLLTISGLAHLTAADHPAVVIYGFFVLLFLSPFIGQKVLLKKSWLLTVNALTLGYLLFGLGQLLIIKVSPLNLASSFLLVLLTNKLLGPNGSRDLLQLVLLSLLQMVITTALSSDLSVGMLLLAYGFILPWTLVTLTFQNALETLASKSIEAPIPLDLITRRKLRLLLVMTGIGIILATGVFFVLVPRIGFGLFAATPSQNTMTGFSSRVNLGDFGLIKTNRQAVMRIKVKDPKRLQKGRHYWRGISLDHYTNGHWSKSFKEQRTLGLPRHGLLALSTEQTGGIEQEIFLEPLAEKVLFGITQINGLSRCPDSGPTPKKTRFFKDQVGDLHYETARPQTLRYCVTSRPVQLSDAHLALDLKAYQGYTNSLSDTFKLIYFQIPTDAIPILDGVIEEMGIETKNIIDLSAQIESFLEANYRYTLNRKVVDPSMPIKDFLVDSPEGHCEYFASAMVLLLRRHGIAARLVNGFAGGRVNKFGNYLLVHQGNAHSWVEVFLPERHCSQDEECRLSGTWQLFDPTPSMETIPEPKSWWRDLVDASRLRWSEYVVRYNLRTQLSWMSEMFQWISPPETADGKRKSKAKLNTTPKTNTSITMPGWLSAITVGIFLIGCIALLRRYLLKRSTRITDVYGQTSILYQRFLAYYQHQGVSYGAHLTAEEFLTHIRDSGHPSLNDASAFTTLYLQMRFSPSVEDLRRLEHLLDLIEVNEPSRK